MTDPIDLAQRFHEAYERLAPEHGYETRPESAVPWEDVPEQNRALMVAVCAEVMPAELRRLHAENERLRAEMVEAADKWERLKGPAGPGYSFEPFAWLDRRMAEWAVLADPDRCPECASPARHLNGPGMGIDQCPNPWHADR